jgi:DNA polymerase
MSTRWAESALSWWEEAGVDTIVGETPHDWLAAKAPAAKASAPTATSAPVAEESLPDELDAFQTWLATTETLPLAGPGARRVPPAGAATSGLMIISDVPSAEDVAAGRLFSGEQGDLLDRMLHAVGLARDAIYLAPFSPIRPTAGKLGQAGVDHLTRIMRHHIALVAPRALLVFGDGCSRALFGAVTAQTRGRWHEVETPQGPVKAVVTMRPQELLNRPKLKALAWADLQMLMEGLKP